MTNNKYVLTWIDEMAAMTQPDKIVWIDGTEEQAEALRAEACSTGEMIKLNQDLLPDCYLHRTAVNDVARVEDRTLICSKNEEDAGPTNHWMDPEKAYAMLYDIAKEFLQGGTNVVLIHSGKLNDGHRKLQGTYGWRIYSIASVNQNTISSIMDPCDILLIDESQRISNRQMEWIIECSQQKQIPIVFSYDPKQYLRSGEDRDVQSYLETKHADIPVCAKKLTTKIRTNKELASFITNLFDIGKSKDHLDYSCVTIEYIANENQLKNYIAYLHQDRGWQPIKYTTSLYNEDPFDSLDVISDKNAHDVIGQEFSKVVFVMDSNFRYDGNRLMASRYAYYSPKGMLYQITTRVVDELKIIVFNNPDLSRRWIILNRIQ